MNEKFLTAEGVGIMRHVGQFMLFAIVIGLVLHGVPAGAQGSTSGLIRGTVTDPQVTT